MIDKVKQMWRKYIIEPMTMTLAEASWFGFVLSTLLLAAAVNIGTSLLLEWTGPGLTLLALLLASFATVIFANYYFHVRRRQLVEAGRRIFAKDKHPIPRKGLIWMVTPAPTVRQAIEYHRVKLQHVWLITTPEMLDHAHELESYLDEYGIKAHVIKLKQAYDAKGCYYLVRQVLEVDAPGVGLTRADIIADMTGGTKPMTAGMVLACNDLDVALEHVPTQFSRDNQPIIPLDPIEIPFGYSTSPIT